MLFMSSRESPYQFQIEHRRLFLHDKHRNVAQMGKFFMSSERDSLLSIDLSPSSYRLELNTNFRIVSVLRLDDPYILAQQQFTRNEWVVFMALLSYYPHYTSYEALLACLTSLSFSNCHKKIQEAQTKGAREVKKELKPVHRALSGLRIKLDRFLPQLKISFIRNLGYLIIIDTQSDEYDKVRALQAIHHVTMEEDIDDFCRP